jgi:formate-dependent phosphoribosylglycinamide formyltransferase (GAR transformylase)
MYYNVSIVDRDAVLRIADDLGVQGIMSFATDPGVVTAAYVAERLGLPTSPLSSVETLQSKDLFRAFLCENGFGVPHFEVVSSSRDAKRVVGGVGFPAVVKPVDSAGSKGVTRVDSESQLVAAVDRALTYSRTGRVIVERYLAPLGSPSDADCLSIAGRLVFTSFTSQFFDRRAPNPYAPSGYAMPSGLPQSVRDDVASDLQRLIDLLGMGSTLYNVETRVDIATNQVYFMEVSPRGGGNRLAEVARVATGVDIIEAAVRSSVGLPVGPLPCSEPTAFVAEVVVHSVENGIFESVTVSPEIAEHQLIDMDVWVNRGTPISAFYSAADAIGTAFFEFQSYAEMLTLAESLNDWVHVNLVR